MTFHHSALCTRIVVPAADCVIAGDRRHQCTLWIDVYVAYWPGVSYKFIRSSIGAQAPSENGSIIRARDHLLQVWMKEYVVDSLFVTLEYFQKTRVVWRIIHCVHMGINL